jgi:hypothetical protein
LHIEMRGRALVRFVAEQSVQWAALFGAAALTLVVAGVTLHIDRKMESFFIQVDPAVADRPTIKAISRLAEALGFEAMPDWECPPQVMEDGAIRHWLVEKEVVHDSSSVQAV